MHEAGSPTSVLPTPFVDLVVVAASAGGLPALIQLFSAVHPPFPAAFIIILHQAPGHPSMLARILTRYTTLDMREAREDDRILPGMALVAPPDQHVEVAPGGRIALTRSERVHYTRPSADVLFKSAALCYHERVIGVILSGTGSDARDGALAIRQAGGRVIAQDQATSAYYGMPSAAIQAGCVDFILPLADIPIWIRSLVEKGTAP